MIASALVIVAFFAARWSALRIQQVSMATLTSVGALIAEHLEPSREAEE